MSDTVTITIDDREYTVPAGSNLVDAAKMCGVDIPVFCYHPKLGHDGNCRMCLVEIGTPRENRETGEVEMAWWRGLHTACRQTVSDGMAVRTRSEVVVNARREILELLLSSHPLDCPVCDKGGECPLQNLTMEHGPGVSRMYYEDKQHLGKHIPLGDLIYLDRERCIHCARCIRFCDLIADDPVLGFSSRGRKQQIVTFSDPPFDSIFSGNTTDICPVGALTTGDFRFRARPWEMIEVATICSHCPVGCNMHFSTRTDREAGGKTTIHRVMPRQNEQVNEVWVCDKGRFGRHYMEHPDRLAMPLIRQGGKLVEATWEQALKEVATQLKNVGGDVAGIAGGRLSNEDLFAFQRLIRAMGSSSLAAYPAHVTGGEFTAQVGVGVGTNFADMGAGTAILVVASDLHQEAPIWWLRVKAAAERGAALIVLNGRDTRLDDYAAHTPRYAYGAEVAALNAMLGCVEPAPGRGVSGLDETLADARRFEADDALKAAARSFAQAENAVVLLGGEGLDAVASHSLAQAAANLLIATGHVGRPNNGLLIVWPGANLQGASDMGLSPNYGPGYQPLDRPGMGYKNIIAALAGNTLKAVYIAGADPAQDDAAVEEALRSMNGTIIVQDMFLTRTAELADVVLPVQSIAEREGTFTSGERRVQRFYPAIEPVGESQPDWLVFDLVGQQLGFGKPAVSVAALLLDIGRAVPQYAGITYQALSRVEPQWPDVGGDDLYYGGTAFQNRMGLGVQWVSVAEVSDTALAMQPAAAGEALVAGDGRLVVVPVRVLYDGEAIFNKTTITRGRVPLPYVELNPEDADQLALEQGDMVGLHINGHEVAAALVIDRRAPRGVALLPMRLQLHATPGAATFASIGKLETA